MSAYNRLSANKNGNNPCTCSLMDFNKNLYRCISILLQIHTTGVRCVITTTIDLVVNDSLNKKSMIKHV